ncbi:MAG TPA: hypothetical protein VM204_07435 [Gaiellaceae bacterium]|nr:hypothetical protein [Gaiellaceae bacterium]
MRTEPRRAAALALAAALPLALLGPAPGDLPAHLYRTELVREGVLLWDTYWFGGHYPLAVYSPLYYFPAALVGNEPLVVAAVVLAAALFAAVVREGWGERTRFAAYAFAVAACGPLFTGTYPYAVGAAAALGCLRLLQLGRVGRALLCAALALGFSPLAFAFLLIVLAAAGLARRRLDGRAVLVGGTLVALALLQVALLRLFPTESEYPFFRTLELFVVLGLGLACGALVVRAQQGRTLALLFGLWLLAALTAYAVPNPVGENVTRLRMIAFPLALLAAALAGYRPRLLAVGTVVAGLAYTLVPYVAVVPYRLDQRPAGRAFWEPALAYVAPRLDPGERLEIVPTGDHWDAYWPPSEDVPIARGWYRQLDIGENPLFYREPLRPGEYRRWLRDRGVRFVLVPDTQLGRVGEEREAELLRSGAAGLERVHRSRTGDVYAVPRARTAGVTVTRLGHDRVEGRVEAAGAHRLALRDTPYWRVEEGDVCLRRAADGATEVVARSAGPFVLGVGLFRRGPRCEG